MGFSHLHLHSDASLLDGSITVDRLIAKVKDMGQSSVAITDHGWLSNAVKLVREAQKNDIKPIVGSELYMVPGQGVYSSPAQHAGDNHHLTVLVQNPTGYRNLMRLSSLAHLGGLSYKPRIDKSLLEEHSDGLILLSGCIAAELPQLIIEGEMVAARELAEWYASVFDGRFFIELMYHGRGRDGYDLVRVEDDTGQVVITEKEINGALVDIAGEVGIPMVATNDAHYLDKDDGCAHDTLLCMGTGSWKAKADRLQFPGVGGGQYEFYVKDEQEMLKACDERYWSEACANTVDVAALVEDSVIELGRSILPDFEVPERDLGFRVYRETGVII